jgi:hypothetical protein
MGPNKPNNHHCYGPKLKFYSRAFVLLGKLTNSNFTLGAFDNFGGPLWHFGV